VPEEFPGDLVNQERYVGADEPETSYHGTPVLLTLGHFSPESTYSLYQAVDEHGKIGIDAFADAIATAIGQEVDVLNLSAGVYMKGCPGVCQFCTAVQRAVDAGVTVVAAAGNQHPDRPAERINCPARFDEAIAAGGCVTECPCAEKASMDIHSNGDSSSGPYWVQKLDDVDYSPLVADGVYCGWRGCVEGGECITKNATKPWEGNVRRLPEKPEVVAPVHHPALRDDDVPALLAGSSFAAPVVSGAVSAILSELSESSESPPELSTLRRAVLEGAVPLDESDLQKLNVTRTLNMLSD
jgi:subtilisin family serine protease